MNIGISESNRLSVSQQLMTLLSNEHILYIKTRKAHWNVEGMDFKAAHSYFQEQYEEIEGFIDDIAERIRSLGHKPTATMKSFIDNASINEEPAESDNSYSLISWLLVDHEAIITYMRGIIQQINDEYGDAGTSNFITDLMEKHEKMAWMLRSHLV